MNVKWLHRLKLGDQPFQTREETSKYTELLPDGTAKQFNFAMGVKSVITRPSPGRGRAAARAGQRGRRGGAVRQHLRGLPRRAGRKAGHPGAAAGRRARHATPGAVQTVGSYWPYAATLFDYIRRAMPFQAPQSLAPDQVYAVTAYLLHLNGIVPDGTVLDAGTLPKIWMLNRNGFSRVYAPP